MNVEHTNVRITSLPISSTILFGIAAYLLYGSIEAVLAVVFLNIMLSTVLFVNVVPVLGIIVYYFGYIHVEGVVLAMAGIEPSILTAVLFATYMFLASVLSFAVTIISVYMLTKKM